jgi:hypothetical protein
MNIRKIIKEELLKEVGGYDDKNIMSIHAGVTMGSLTEIYNDLTNTLQGLANAIMDGHSKEDFVIYLTETSEEIDTLVDAIKIIVGEFTEDDLIRKAKKIIRSLKNFKNNIDDLVNNSSDTMISDEEFVEEVKNLLIKLLPSLKEYGEQLQITNKVFKDRLTGHSRSSFGSGFSLN